MTTWPRQADVNAFYGNPDTNRDGRPDRAWEDGNLVSLTPPYPMVLAWDTTAPVRSIRVHTRCAASLNRCLTGIRDHYGSAAAIREARMHLFGGAYNFRLMRGGNRLSMHSWGCAIDLDPERNGLGVKWKPNAGMMPREVIDIFMAEAWVWGGDWSRPDAMHFQAATV